MVYLPDSLGRRPSGSKGFILVALSHACPDEKDLKLTPCAISVALVQRSFTPVEGGPVCLPPNDLSGRGRQKHKTHFRRDKTPIHLTSYFRRHCPHRISGSQCGQSTQSPERIGAGAVILGLLSGRLFETADLKWTARGASGRVQIARQT